MTRTGVSTALGFVWKKVEREVLRAGEDNPKRTRKHVHDGLGRLVEVLKDGVSQVRYGYTADGRLARRREVAAGRTVWYVHDGRQVIQEIQTAPSTVLVQEYCWQETTLLETRKPGGWIRTLHQDRLGSVVAATAGGGGTVTIEARTAYDPYGRPVSLPSWSAAGVESIVPFGYTGTRWEDLAALDVDVDADGTVESVGLYAMGARWYDAEMGRFLEQDPLGEVAGSNLYAYVDASPVMWVDPSGLARQYRSFVGYPRSASWRPESPALRTNPLLEFASSSRLGTRTLVDATSSTVGSASKDLSGLGESSAAARQVAAIASAGAAPLGIWAPWEDPPFLEPRIDPLGPPCVRCFQVEGGTAEEQLKLKETLEKLRRSLKPQTIDYFRTTYGVDINEILTDGKGPVLNILHLKGSKIAEYDPGDNEVDFNIDYYTFGVNNKQFDEEGAMRTALHESEHYANDVASWFGDLDPPYDVRIAGRILNQVGADAYWDPLSLGGHDGKPYGWIAVMIQFGSVRR